MIFGEKLQKLRKSRGMSQEQLADQIGVSRQAVSKWELGESTPDLDNVVQLSDVFGVTTDYLLKESETELVLSSQSDSHAIGARILQIASVAFLAIGLFSAFGGWHEFQNAETIWGSMIIQVIGVVMYFIAKALSDAKMPFVISFANLAIGLFLPISMLVSAVLTAWMSPYPTDLSSGLVFCALYGFAIVVVYFVMKRRQKR